MISRKQVLQSLVLILLCATGLQAQSHPEWHTPFPPHRIAGNLYYVGSQDLAAFLIATPEGHILINSNLESSVPQIKESVEKLGFHFNDIKILLISHAHFDHCAGSALIKETTGAKYMRRSPLRRCCPDRTHHRRPHQGLYHMDAAGERKRKDI